MSGSATVSFVLNDDPRQTISALQIRHLTEHGHSRIALALPEEDSALARARRRFAEHTLDSLGLPPPVPFTVPRPRRAGTGAVAALRAAHPDVTAVAAFDDDLALRTLTALHDLGLTVPGDLAVIGYDDTEYGELSTPARTALGLDAAGLVPVPARIIVRDSV